jgi:hypothetical protein
LNDTTVPTDAETSETASERAEQLWLSGVDKMKRGLLNDADAEFAEAIDYAKQVNDPILLSMVWRDRAHCAYLYSCYVQERREDVEPYQLLDRYRDLIRDYSAEAIKALGKFREFGEVYDWRLQAEYYQCRSRALVIDLSVSDEQVRSGLVGFGIRLEEAVEKLGLLMQDTSVDSAQRAELEDDYIEAQLIKFDNLVRMLRFSRLRKKLKYGPRALRMALTGKAGPHALRRLADTFVSHSAHTAQQLSAVQVPIPKREVPDKKEVM